MIITDVNKLTIPTDDFDFSNPPVDPSKLSKKLVDVMYRHQGLGLSAIQIDIQLNVFAVRGSPENLVMFNAKIVHRSDSETLMEEGCLSFPGLVCKIKRSNQIRVRFQGPDGQTRTEVFNGLTSRVIQHEIDHCNGVLFYNKANKYHRDLAFRKLKNDRKNI